MIVSNLVSNGGVMEYTLWSFDITMENGPVLVDLPIRSGDFQ